MLPDAYCFALLDHPTAGGAAAAALDGDSLARLATADHLEEQNVRNPFEVGKCYLICTVTLYFVGRVVESDLAWITLADASWVHRTGRLSTLIRRQSFTAPDVRDRARVEPCGEAILSLGSIVAAYPWTGKLPAEAQP